MATPAPAGRSGGILGFIERLGNLLPNPVFLFIGATALVFALSGAGDWLNWGVQPVRPRMVMEVATDESGQRVERPATDSSGRPRVELVPSGEPVRPRSLVTGDGVYWLFANMVRNFINFAPLGVVLVSMLGIGVAERVGLFGAAMKAGAAVVPGGLLTPMVIFLGILSNMASDAGYIVLPPLAAGLFAASGRHPVAGIAAAFAGIAGGFSANLVIASTDALVAPLTERAAQVIDPAYTVLVTCNWYFLAASVTLVTLVGWAVTALVVEPRLLARQNATPWTADAASPSLSPAERKGLAWAGAACAGACLIAGLMIAVPGAPLHGPMPAPAPAYGLTPLSPAPLEGAFRPDEGQHGARRPEGMVELDAGLATDAAMPGPDGSQARGVARTTAAVSIPARFEPSPAPQPRWSQAIVPLIFLVFLAPGLAYGVSTRTLKSTADVAGAFIHSMASMAPIIAMAFFAAQFIECLRFSQLDRMLAFAGGKALVASGLPPTALLVGIIGLVMIINVLVSSMSAKWTALAPILVPMLMMAGLSPELTQAAYRVGDSVTNIVTPLNAYILIILVTVQKYDKGAGLGSLIAMMLPYTVVFAVVWTLFLVAWVALGVPLGPGAPLWYAPVHDAPPV